MSMLMRFSLIQMRGRGLLQRSNGAQCKLNRVRVDLIDSRYATRRIKWGHINCDWRHQARSMMHARPRRAPSGSAPAAGGAAFVGRPRRGPACCGRCWRSAAPGRPPNPRPSRPAPPCRSCSARSGVDALHQQAPVGRFALEGRVAQPPELGRVADHRVARGRPGGAVCSTTARLRACRPAERHSSESISCMQASVHAPGSSTALRKRPSHSVPVRPCRRLRHRT